MSAANRRGRTSQPNRRARGQGSRSDLWRKTPEPPAADPIEPTPAPTALLYSLGPPPLPGQPASATQSVGAVIERAAALAAALATSAGLLRERDEALDTEPTG